VEDGLLTLSSLSLHELFDKCNLRYISSYWWC